MLLHLVSGCCGFLMAQTGIFGNYSPFGIAITAALPVDYILSGAVGAGAGYLLTKDMDMPLRYIAALTIITITAYSVRKSKNIKSDTLILSLCAFGAAFLSGIAVCIADGFSAGALVMYLGESLLAGGSTYFFKKSFDTGERGIKALTGTEKSCLVITGSIFIACASGVTIFSISPGRIFAVLIILFAAAIWEERGGAIAGAAIGAVMSLIPGCGHIGGVYAAGGVVAGVFSGGGRFASACAFVLAGGIVTLAATGGENALPTLVETAIATVIFVVLPKNISESIKKLLLTLDEQRKNLLNPSQIVEKVLAYYEPILIDKYDDYTKRLKDLEHFLYLSSQYNNLEDFLSDLALEPPDSSVSEVEDGAQKDEYLTLSTIHSAKGLEWKAVFIIGAVDGRFPSVYSFNSEEELDEELRLMYVAATRAKSYLYITYPIDMFDYSSGMVLSKPSRFLDGIEQDILEKWVLEIED